MSNLKKRILSFCLSIVFVLAALAVPLTTGAEETGHLCFELPNDCSHCADHDAADVCDEKIGTEYTPRIIYDCGCSTGNAGTYITNTNDGNVRIRAGHSTNTAVIGQIPYGSTFSVSAASSTWAHVNYNGTIGYVSMSVIKKDSGNSNPSCGCSIVNAGTYTTNTNGGDVNIRAGHSTNTDAIGKIPYGSSFHVSRASSDWAHITYNGTSGYVSMTVIRKVSGNTNQPSYTFTIESYVDRGFLQRFSNGISKVLSYSDTVKQKLEAVFPVRVNIQTNEEDVKSYTSYCDTCKWRSSGGSWVWNTSQLSWKCSHDALHLTPNPGLGTGNTSTGFYFDFIRNNGVGTKTLTKVMWTGHIAYELKKDENGEEKLVRPQAVSYYNDEHISAWHNIALIPPTDVVNASNGYSTLSNEQVKRIYEYTLLHEVSHTLSAPDHYRCWDDKCTCSSPATCGKSHNWCSNAGCWECRRYLRTAAGNRCIMMWSYTSETDNVGNMDVNKLYCPQCRAYIRDHLADHHG